MYTIIYYSPTGNALHLAKLLADGLKIPRSELQAMELTDPEKLQGNHHLILLHPIHGFNAPKSVKQFVKSLPEGLYEYVSLIAVGCAAHWANDAVSAVLRKSLRKKKFSIVLDEVLAMPLTFIMNFPDDMNRRLIAESEQRIENLCQRIRERDASEKNVLFKSRIFNFLSRVEPPAAKLFGLELRAKTNCTSCGTCWNNCPQNNIREKSNGKPGFGFNCSMCLRCIYNCPEKAISPRFSKFIPIKGGYSLSKYLAT
jgi:ferredoxin/flavodoxin